MEHVRRVKAADAANGLANGHTSAAQPSLDDQVNCQFNCDARGHQCTAESLGSILGVRVKQQHKNSAFS